MKKLFIIVAVLCTFPVQIFAAPSYTSVILAQMNVERRAAHLSPLKENPKLTRAAELKLADMLAVPYFAHKSPAGRSYPYFIDKAGYPRKYAGENLARYFESPKDVMTAFMASPTHRANVLSKNFVDVGLAYAFSTLVVEFGSRR